MKRKGSEEKQIGVLFFCDVKWWGKKRSDIHYLCSNVCSKYAAILPSLQFSQFLLLRLCVCVCSNLSLSLSVWHAFSLNMYNAYTTHTHKHITHIIRSLTRSTYYYNA
jgi:hypothetical protein